MGHVPVSSPGTSTVAELRKLRKMVHVNTTNPMLDESVLSTPGA
jgi:hypothetical protein